MIRFLLLLFLNLPLGAQAATLYCVVVNVADGDTLTCLDSHKLQHKIRLVEIDAPERGQAYGNKSRQYLRDLVMLHQVRIEISGYDRYHRTLGTVYRQQDNINLTMVNNGMAWAYKRYLKDRTYLIAEQHARQLKRGLWADPKPIYPEDFRQSKRRAKSSGHP